MHIEEIEALVPRDEEGFFQLVLASGNTVAFAPSYKIGQGMAEIINEDSPELVDLAAAFRRPGRSKLWINVHDFESLLEGICYGAVKPYSANDV